MNSIFVTLFGTLIAAGMSPANAVPQNQSDCAENLVNKNYKQKVSARLLAKRITNECWAPFAPKGFEGDLKESVDLKFREVKAEFEVLVYEAILQKKAEHEVRLNR